MLLRIRSALLLALEGIFTLFCSLIVLLVALTPGLRRHNGRLITWWARSVLRLAGVRWRTEGVERVPEGPCVMVANHLSALDIPLLVACLPGPPRFMAKHTLFHLPIFGWAMRLEGFVPVDRTRGHRARASLEPATEALRRGRRILVFPEGTRSRTGRTGAFKTGAFRLALATGAPIVPVALIGTDRLFPPQSKILHPGEVELVVGEVVETVGRAWAERNQLRDEVRAWVIARRGEEPQPVPGGEDEEE
jgi:1-acyl-sn-glycerol-3-phosphate acyltransferase